MREEVRAKEGWTEAFISGGPHLKRAVEMYQEMGYEVHLEEIDPRTCDGCTACYEDGNETMYRVYVRASEQVDE
ncbi:MAG: hypothetical protein SV910_06125 [Chloroflexota bacterium]|nr:hypothetical protein [Chloroflexota bacterium]